MSDKEVHDYLMRGIHGPKELRPEEKNRYLGTFRERVVIVLTQPQIRRPELYPEIKQALIRYPDATMLLNGEMEYDALSKYIQLAIAHNIPYSKYSDHLSDSDLGLVIALPRAVEIAQIEISESQNSGEKVEKKEDNRSPFFKRLIKRNR